MATQSVTKGLLNRESRVAAAPTHAEMVAFYRAKLAGYKGILEGVDLEQLALAREEFRLLPEISGRPLAVKKPRRGRAS
jgi:hypothetical protein